LILQATLDAPQPRHCYGRQNRLAPRKLLMELDKLRAKQQSVRQLLLPVSRKLLSQVTE
jgi:hypothetical protein